MKKYVKPELCFERFELSRQIAACTYDSNNTQDNVGCAFTGRNEFTGETVTLFLEATAACTTKADSYCYHGSSGGMFSIFNS